MTATYSYDVFSSLDGYGSHRGDWGGYWGRQGPEFLAHRAARYREDQRIVLGANTYRLFSTFWAGGTDGGDEWLTSMRRHPTTVVSTTLDAPLAWPATVRPGDAVDVVARLKQESDVPLRSHGSLSMNRALLAAGLVDRIELTVFPALTGRTGRFRIFDGGADFDLELIDSCTFDGDIQQLVYRPTLHS